MQRTRLLKSGVGITALLLLLTPTRPSLQESGGVQSITATDLSELRQTDRLVDDMLGVGELRVTRIDNDTLTPGRLHERLIQYHDGVPVFGAGMTRQTDRGLTVSIFGRIHRGITIDATPTVSASAARAIVAAHLGVDLRSIAEPELMILRDPSGVHRLVRRVRGFASSAVMMCFVDAHTGAVVWEYNDLKTQNATLPCTDCAVGRGRGVKGDLKKVSVRPVGGVFRADDRLRPPVLRTYDMRGDWRRTEAVVFSGAPLFDSDLAADGDNNWADGANVDGHVGAGWTYDYLFDRFGRRGLNGNDSPMDIVIHPVRRADIFIVPDEIFSLFHFNAFYCHDCGPNGLAVFGEGFPPGFFLPSTGQMVDFFAAGLDVVAHELAHGVTEFTSQLIYQNESGALNEAFSDIIGTGTEFFVAETGRHAPERADYILGEDIFKPGGIRSLADPGSRGDPDHYTQRFTGTTDNGGVHTNSMIPGHAFYLAIEGGVNHTSGLEVSGVGADRRDQVEQLFYRAFTLMLPADATFAMARAATIQSARDLFGAGSAAEWAVTDAWTAVGVF